jgi:hypothetical protein
MTVVYSDGFQQGWNHVLVTTTAGDTGTVSTWVNGVKQHSVKENFIPVRVIYNPPLTICIFPDGEKVIVRCADDEEYVKDVGVMACITKKVMSRNAFKKLVKSGYEQPTYKELPKNIKSEFPTKFDITDTQSTKEILKRIKEIFEEELKESKKYKKDQWG